MVVYERVIYSNRQAHRIVHVRGIKIVALYY
jgi:hypothetical protein